MPLNKNTDNRYEILNTYVNAISMDETIRRVEEIIKRGIPKSVTVFSFMIEFTQLLFHLGTFQISDLTYNTLGGAVGGVIYYLGYSRKRKK